MTRWKIYRVFMAVLLFPVIFMVIGGCAGESKRPIALSSSVYSNKLVVLPFQAVPAKGSITACPICRQNNPAGPITPDAARILTDMLVTGLERRGFVIVPMSEVERALLAIGEEKAAAYPIETAKKLAKKFNVKLVMAGAVFEYKSREGSSIGVEQPAAVSFSLHLIEGETGRILWKDKYYESQKALSEDITNIGKFIKRSGKWVTARRLAYDGMNTLLDNLPDFQ